MIDENYLTKKIEEAVGKERSYLKYHLDFQNKGELYPDGEKVETPDYSFGEIFDVVKRARLQLRMTQGKGRGLRLKHFSYVPSQKWSSTS